VACCEERRQDGCSEQEGSESSACHGLSVPSKASHN
jgi:hypothetical protein